MTDSGSRQTSPISTSSTRSVTHTGATPTRGGVCSTSRAVRRSSAKKVISATWTIHTPPSSCSTGSATERPTTRERSCWWPLPSGFRQTGACKKVGVARQDPSSVGLLAQDGQRLARSSVRLSAGRCHRHGDAVTDPCPVVRELELLDLGTALDPSALQGPGRFLELVFAERRPPGYQKEDVVRHQPQDSLDVTRCGRLMPPGHQASNRTLILFQYGASCVAFHSRPCGPALGRN
jgi:hypothetical protein